MPKAPKKKLHRGKKANRRRQIHQRGLTKTMKMVTEPVLNTITATETALATATAKGGGDTNTGD